MINKKDLTEEDIIFMSKLNNNPKLKDLINKSFENDKLMTTLINIYDMQS